LEALAQNVGKTNRLEHGWETSLTSLHGEEAAEGGRGLSGLATDRAAEVALVCEAEFGGEACDVGLSVGEAVEGGSHAQPDAMAGDGVSGDRMENAAEVVRGDAERARQVREGTKWVGGERFASAVREHASSASRGRPVGGDATWIQLLERAGGELDSTLEELVGPGAARFGEETAMLEIDPPRRGKRARRQGRLATQQ
jgi:hypothetical protein